MNDTKDLTEINTKIKSHYDSAMNSLKDKNYVDAYNNFYYASTISKINELKDFYLQYTHMAATMLVIEFKNTADRSHLNVAIEIMEEGIQYCLEKKVQFDIFLLVTLLCDCYELISEFHKIEALHINNIAYIKENYSPDVAMIYAKNYSTLYYKQSLAVKTEENKHLIVHYSRLSIFLLIEIFKINKDKTIYSHFIDRETLYSLDFSEQEIDDIIKLFDDGKVTEITLEYNK